MPNSTTRADVEAVKVPRHFLGWENPILPTTSDRLYENYCRGKQWNLRNVLIVLPSGLAVRRLTELLAIRAQQTGCLLYPPEMITAGGLPERLYSTKLPVANEHVQTLAWVAALQNSPSEDLRMLVPQPPQRTATQQWLELARILANLHCELASDTLDFEMVAKALGKNHIESPRWLALAKIQRLYLDELHSLQLWDVQTARLVALREGEATTSRQIIVIGCVDLNRVQRGFLNAVAAQVQIWVAAPPSLSQTFDPLGCLDPEQWQSQTIDLPADCLVVGNSPSDQAELVAASLAQLGKHLHIRQVTLGVPDSSLIPELRHRLAQSGLRARFGPGEPLSNSSPVVLLALISQFIEQKNYASLAALVRQPAVASMLSADRWSLPAGWLSQLDDYFAEALPDKLDGFVNKKQKAAPVFRAVTQAVTRWLKPLDKRTLPVSRWVNPIREVLLAALQAMPHLEHPADFPDNGSKLVDAVAQVGALLMTLQDIPEKLQPKMSLSDLIEWLIRNMSGQLVPEPDDPSALEMLGWLDLGLDDSPALVIAGLHDGVVPESVSADAFLPNQLRRQLGMLDNARRMARDVYLFKLILANRKHIRIVVGKTDASGDPLIPSRLLLACDLGELPTRVLHLVKEENADVLPELKRNDQPLAGPSRLPIPRPEPTFPPTYITVTAFRDYLKCPYRFYLRHVLRLRSQSDAGVELDASMFGNLVHSALDRLAGSPQASSTNPEEVGEFLAEQLQEVALHQYGPTPPATALIQIEQAQLRLQAFAVRQAERAAQGWEIRFTEQGSRVEDRIMVGKNKELCLVGRIDRIDYHPKTGDWAIWDYKTSETAKRPESVHFSHCDGWLDLQLPLYIPIARKLGVTGLPSVGYIALPKRLEDINFYPAEFGQAMLEEAWKKADEVASRVAECDFWPESIEAVEYDDFARICQVQSQRVQAPPPRRRLFRFDGYQNQRASPQVVEMARQKLDQPASRSPVLLDPLLIRASAGTGKTFQLSNRLLYILLSGHDVDTILATTFTRKAAGEILQRVLQRLALGCISAEQRQELVEQLPGVDCSAASCLATLRRVTASIHRLRISTLDSFFSQLARTFSLDMGLPAGWNTMEPSQETTIQMQAISDMLGSNDRQTLMELVRMLFKGESNRRVSDDIRMTVENGLAFFRCTAEEAWDRLPLRTPPDESLCQSAIQTLATCRMGDRRIDTGLDKLAASAMAGDWAELLGHSVTSRVRSGTPTYYNKELPGNLVDALELLVDKAQSELLPIYRRQTLATHQVLQAYDQSYQELLRKYRTLAFADVSHFLSKWLATQLLENPSSSGMAQLSFRLDCSIQHLLLDEFQDTSLEQWDILRPLAEPLGKKQSDHSFFCVGDSKQAIYGWRGGVAEIFDSVVETISGLKDRDLKKSYRSSPPIMQAVNEVFRNLDRHSNYSGCEATAQLWQDHFPVHETARTAQTGYVQLVNGPQAEDDQLTSEERRIIFLDHTVQRVAELVESSSASIGILVRTNDDVARIMALLRERNISGSQDGGNPLTDSAAVELILSLIHLADHPGDGICGFHVCNSPLAVAFPASSGGTPEKIAGWFSGLISTHGLGPAIEWLAHGLASHLSWWDQQRVEQLIRLAYEHHSTAGRLRDFESFVERHRVALPSESQVKVMTIHKSKGLEFDAVFLPSLDVSMTGSIPQLIARRPGPCKPPDGVLRYMNANLQTLLPQDWQRAFQADKASSVYESLCMLYVAMTRARRALYMTTLRAGREPRQDLGSLLQSTLTNGSDLAKEPSSQLYSLGNAEWYVELPKQSELSQARSDGQDSIESGESTKTLSIQLGREASQAPLRGLRVSLPSDAGRELEWRGTAGNQAEQQIPGQRSIKREEQIEFLRDAMGESLAADGAANAVFGKLIHCLLAQIQWLDDFSMDHAQLTRMAGSFLQADELRHVSLSDAFTYVETALSQPEVQAILTRNRNPKSVGSQVADEIVVENERPIRAILDGQLVVGTIDRFVVFLAKGVPIAAEVIDYKTDSPEGQPPLLWLDERVAHHRPQLELYGLVVAELYGIEVKMVSHYLIMLATGRCVPVGNQR